MSDSTQPAAGPSERELLIAYLGAARRHVLGILEGLDEDAMRRPVLPSGWACRDLVHHLGQFTAFVEATGYRTEAERSDAILAEADLDAPPRWWPDFMGPHAMDSVRDVVLHVLLETGTHAGHLDAVRELIDGRQWIVLEG